MNRLRVAASFLSVFFSLGSLWAADTPKYGGRLTFGIRNDISSLNPFLRTASTNFYVRGLMYEALLDFDRAGRIVPAIAESWTVSPDGKTYTFKLRNGVKFHDGKSLTAEDVKWSVEYALDPKNTASGLAMLPMLAAVNTKDNATVEFVLKRMEAAFANLLATVRPFPVVPKGSVPPGGKGLPAFPPGTGPFVFKDYKPAREIVFVRNKNYWQKGLPYLDEIILKPVPEDQIRFTSVRAGDLDMIERTPYFFVAKLLRGEFADIRATEAKYAAYRRLRFNVADAPFDNLKLRQAVLYALSKKNFIDGAFWGFGVPTDQLYPKESQWHVTLPETKPDSAKVSMLLKEGSIDSSLEFELSGVKSEEEELQVLQRQLVTAGIRTKVVILERGAREAREKRGDFMMALAGSDIPNDPSEEYPNEYGCNEEEVKAKARTENSTGYCNREIDRLLQEAGKISDPKKRYLLYAKVTQILHEEIPTIPLAFVPRFFAYNKKVRGFETDCDGRFNMTSAGLSRVWIER
jgi:ABC-type transport system substrate-binding protein